jgi:hypothetical protein
MITTWHALPSTWHGLGYSMPSTQHGVALIDASHTVMSILLYFAIETTIHQQQTTRHKQFLKNNKRDEAASNL